MTEPTDVDLAEVLTDLCTVRDQVRAVLPVIINTATRDGGWPDTVLSDVAATLAEGVERLDAVAGLLGGMS